MRIPWRTTDRQLRRDVALVCLADGIVAVSFGATAVAGGLAWWVPVVMSLFVFAGGAQFAAVGVVLAGGSPVAAAAAGVVLNTRLLPYSFAVADVTAPARPADASGAAGAAGAAGGAGASFGSGASGRSGAAGLADEPGAAGGSGAWRRWLTRMVGAHLTTDESVAFALRHTDQAPRRAAFWTCGVALFTVWNAAVLLGVLAGTAVRNTAAFGLDATFPAVLLALALPTLADNRTRAAAGTGAVTAVALTPLLPAGLPVLAALGGLACLWRRR